MSEIEFLVNTNPGQLAYPGYVASELQRICEIWYDKEIRPQVAKAALAATIQAALEHGINLDTDHGLSWGTLLTCFCCNMDYQKSQGQLNVTRFQNMSPQRAEVVKLLLAAGADPNARENWGKTPYWTPLMRAGWAGNTPQMKVLLADKKTQVDLRAGDNPARGDTALIFATEAGKHEAVALLLQAGANPMAPNSDGVPIYNMATANWGYGPDIARVFYSNYYRRSPNRSAVPAP